VHVQETSLGMPCLPCKSPLTPLYQRGDRRKTMANKVPWFCTSKISITLGHVGHIVCYTIWAHEVLPALWVEL
jgi:hypothetical protein